MTYIDDIVRPYNSLKFPGIPYNSSVCLFILKMLRNTSCNTRIKELGISPTPCYYDYFGAPGRN